MPKKKNNTPDPTLPIDPPLDQYRDSILALRTSAEQEFDKLILYLSAGAISISMAFIKDIVGGSATLNAKELMIQAWFLWSGSLGLILVSFITSKQSATRILKQIYNDTFGDDYFPGGAWTVITNICNYGALFALIGGLIKLFLFIQENF